MRRLSFLLLSLVTACAGGTRPPATSPITETGIVGGRIEMPNVAGAAVPAVLVSVAGTSLYANVSRLGDFVVANVPAGPLELRFTGDGIAAVLPLGTIAAGETLTVSVRLRPAAAAADAVSRVRGTDALVEGVIEQPGNPLPRNMIIVGGRTITIPDGVAAPPLEPGMRVRVTGTVSSGGMTAREIAVL